MNAMVDGYYNKRSVLTIEFNVCLSLMLAVMSCHASPERRFQNCIDRIPKLRSFQAPLIHL